MEGNIISAAQAVIQELVRGEKSNSAILYIWDQLRGSDTFENYVNKQKLIEIVNKGETN